MTDYSIAKFLKKEKKTHKVLDINFNQLHKTVGNKVALVSFPFLKYKILEEWIYYQFSNNGYEMCIMRGDDDIIENLELFVKMIKTLRKRLKKINILVISDSQQLTSEIELTKMSSIFQVRKCYERPFETTLKYFGNKLENSHRGWVTSGYQAELAARADAKTFIKTLGTNFVYFEEFLNGGAKNLNSFVSDKLLKTKESFGFLLREKEVYDFLKTLLNKMLEKTGYTNPNVWMQLGDIGKFNKSNKSVYIREILLKHRIVDTYENYVRFMNNETYNAFNMFVTGNKN